jgi:hypothetical protein
MMMVGSAHDVRVMVAINGARYEPANDTQVITGKMPVVTRELGVDLDGGSAFEVSDPPGGRRQRLKSNQAEWVFKVKALESGEKTLVVLVSQYNSQELEATKTEKWKVSVSIDTLPYVRDYLAMHLPEAVGGGIVGLVVAGFAYMAAKLKKKG